MAKKESNNVKVFTKKNVIAASRELSKEITAAKKGG